MAVAGVRLAAALRRPVAATRLIASVLSSHKARPMSVLLKRYEGQHEIKNFTMVRSKSFCGVLWCSLRSQVC